MLISKGLLLFYLLSTNKYNLKLKCTVIYIISIYSNAEASLVLGAGIGSRACAC